MDDEEKFFEELRLMIGDALDISDEIDKYWSKRHEYSFDENFGRLIS